MARVPRFRTSATPDPHPSSDATITDSPFQQSQIHPRPKLNQSLGPNSSSIAAQSVSSASSPPLTNTKQYSIRHISNVPPELCKNTNSSRYRVTLEPRCGLAVATTDRDVVVWAYGTPGGEANPQTLSLPESVGQYPLAAIIPAQQTNGNEAGLVLISQRGGKIVYWDSIDVMLAYGFRKDRHTVETSIVGIYDSDEAVELVEVAGAGGFVIRMRSGKLVLLALHDNRGRVGVKSAMLSFEGSIGNGTSSVNGGGFFAGLKNVLFSGPPKNSVAVRTMGASAKGTGRVVLATRTNLIIWDVDWTGQHRLRGDLNIQQQINSQLQSSNGSLQLAELADIAVTQSTGTTIELVALVVKVQDGQRLYSLAEIIVETGLANGLEMELSRVVACPPLDVSENDDDPQLVVHNGPLKSALIVFPTAVVITSLGRIPFQDLVLFQRQSRGIVSCIGEGLGSNSKLSRGSTQGHFLLVLSTDGVLKLTVEGEVSKSKAPQSTLTAQERFELAAFYGSVPANPIDFLTCDHLSYGPAEVETAALAVSGSVVLAGVNGMHGLCNPGIQGNSSADVSSLLDKSATGASNILELALKLNPKLSIATRWTLLADLERLEVARRILGEGIDGLSFKMPESNEFDRTVGLAELLLPRMGHSMVEAARALNSQNPPALSKVLARVELTDRIFIALEAAFKIREECTVKYGLDQARFNDSLLSEGFEGAPPFWTSSSKMIHLLKVQAAASCAVIQFVGASSASNPLSAEMKSRTRALAEGHVRLVDIACRTIIEHVNWSEASEDEDVRLQGEKDRKSFEDNDRSALIRPLSQIGLARPGLEVAERYRDMGTLSFLLLEQLVNADSDLAEARKHANASKSGLDAMLDDSEVEPLSFNITAIENHYRDLQDTVKRFFEEYGTQFSDKFFDTHLTAEMMHSLVTARFCGFPGGKEAVGEYLHRKQMVGDSSDSLHPIVWIFDALNRNYGAAAATLFRVAGTESSSAARMTDLAIAKVLSCDYRIDPEQGSIINPTQNIGVDYTLDVGFRAARVQELLVNAVSGAVKKVLSGPSHKDTIENAVIDLFASHLEKSSTAKIAAIKKEARSLVKDAPLNIEGLIDLLTLLDGDGGFTNVDKKSMAWSPCDNVSRFSAAFAILQPAILAGSCGYLPKLVLKRLILKDNWLELSQQMSTDDSLADVDMATGSAPAVDFSSTLLYKMIVSSPTDDMDFNSGLQLSRVALVEVIRKIIALSEHDYIHADPKQTRQPAQIVSGSSSMAILLSGAGTAPDLISRLGEQRALALGSETEADDRQLQAMLVGDGERAVALCLRLAENVEVSALQE